MSARSSRRLRALVGGRPGQAPPPAEASVTLVPVADFCADDAFLSRVIGFGHLLLDLRRAQPRKTTHEKQVLFDATFDRGDRRAAMEWLRAYLPPDDIAGLHA